MKKIKWYIYVIGALSLITIGSLIFSAHTIAESEIYETELKRQYDADVNESNRRLRESLESRDSANLAVTRLTVLNKALVASDSVSKAKLARIPGKFQNLSSKQLQDKMIEEYESR